MRCSLRVKNMTSALAFSLLLPACDPGSPAGDPVGGGAQALEQDMLQPLRNDSGYARTASATGAIDTSNPFFRPLGTNGRSCGTCHQADQGWSITPEAIRARFESSEGMDPLFRAHDGANAPNLDVSTVEARRSAYGLLLERGVIRIGLPVKSTSEFDLVAVDDPYNWASATQLSLFRRPLPTTNLRLATSLSWDGRATVATDPTNLRLGLKNQSNGATVNHAQATAPIDDATRDAIVDFETSITTAQVWDENAGSLTSSGGRGGPDVLLNLPFSIGLNDPFDPSFDPRAFTLFNDWSDSGRNRRRVFEGQEIFNTKQFTVSLPDGQSFQTTCSGCHSLPDVGAASAFRLFDVGISSPSRRAANVPLYTFRNKLTGQEVQTTDPGRALLSGLWADMNRFKAPSLRALAARAPYFHDGSVGSLDEVVDFYETQFNIAFADGEKRKLVRFLQTL